MKSALKLVVVLILLAVIAGAVWWGQNKSLEPPKVETPMVSKATNVQPGAITIDGSPDEWGEIARFVVSRTSALVPAQSPAEANWTEVRMAHDGTSLYLRISMNMDIEQVVKGGGGIGNIYIDSDDNAKTGQEESDGTRLYGYDCGIQFMPGMGRKPGEKGPPSISWFQVKCDKDVSSPDMASRACCLDKPDMLSFKGQFIEFKYPLAKLNIKPPCKTAFSFQPTYLHDSVIYSIDFE